EASFEFHFEGDPVISIPMLSHFYPCSREQESLHGQREARVRIGITPAQFSMHQPLHRPSLGCRAVSCPAGKCLRYGSPPREQNRPPAARAQRGPADRTNAATSSPWIELTPKDWRRPS